MVRRIPRRTIQQGIPTMAIGLTPYFNFPNSSREAMEFYASIFGGQLDVMTYGQGVGDTNPQTMDNVMHASLFVGPGFHLMASDVTEDSSPNATVALSSDGEGSTDADTLKGYWDRLTEGATILEALAASPWGSTFGMLTDRYGITWLFDI